MSSTNTHPNKYHGPLRPRGIGLLFTIIGLVGLYLVLFVDFHIKNYLERIGTRLNGAKVNIGSVHLSLLRSEFELRRLEIAHHTQPMKNLIEIDRINVQFLFLPLLGKKIIIKEMELSGFHYRTEREYSGILPMEMEEPPLPSAFIDRAASGFYSELRSQTNDNPLRGLGQLISGVDVHNSIASVSGDLGSLKKIYQFKEDIFKAAEQWEKGLKDLALSNQPLEIKSQLDRAIRIASEESAPEVRRIRTDIQGKLSQLESLENAIRHRIETLNGNIKMIELATDKDIADVETKLKLPRFDVGDLTPQIFGPKLLNWLERTTYWVDFTRRRMPPGTRQGTIAMVVREPSHGTSIHFGKMAAYPAVLIYKMLFSSELSEETKACKVTGVMTGLTSDPPIHGRPLELSLEAEMPSGQLKGGKIRILIDHTLGKLEEKIEFKVGSISISDLNIIDSSDLKFGIKKATGSVDATINFHENELQAEVRTALYQVEYDLNSRYRRMEKSLNDILQASQSIDLVAKIEGPLEKLKLSASSNLGQRLSIGLEDEFKHQLSIVKDMIRRGIEDRVSPEREPLYTKYRDLQEKILTPIRTQTEFMRKLLQYANDNLSKLEGKRPRAQMGLKKRS